jgi:hypothetical protein
LISADSWRPKGYKREVFPKTFSARRGKQLSVKAFFYRLFPACGKSLFFTVQTHNKKQTHPVSVSLKGMAEPDARKISREKRSPPCAAVGWYPPRCAKADEGLFSKPGGE